MIIKSKYQRHRERRGKVIHWIGDKAIILAVALLVSCWAITLYRCIG